MKIQFIETAHWLFHMAAQYRRLLALQLRKGVTLSPRKTVDANWGLEHADLAVINGNEFTMGTYRYANKPLYRLPIISPLVCPFPADKDYASCRKHCLWFGSDGLVHKGLDLVLDVFAEMPDYHLTVCGPIKADKEFEQAYYNELYKTANIHTLGWVDARSPEFEELARNCIGIVYPSCSEGGSGCVITCMQAALIPIVSYESGVDIDGFGVVLNDSSSIEEIRNAVKHVSGLPVERLDTMSRNAWETATATYTRRRFAQKFKKIISTVTSEPEVARV